MRGATDDAVEGTPFSVVFVCTGNQARSALAEAFMRERVGGLAVEVGSRGTEHVAAAPALPAAVSAGAARGVDLGSHLSRPLARRELENADLVIGFEPYHVAAAVVDGGAARERSFLLRELAELLVDRPDPGVPSRADVVRRVEDLDRLRLGRPRPASLSLPDPAGKPASVFTALALEIDDFTRRLCTSLFGADR
jgi:protein-tyrosine phosphatase